MNFNELMVAEDNQMTEKQIMFVNVHKSIIMSGRMITNFAVDLAKLLKKMRDEKLYLEAGFETFADYAEEACGIKERQAYNYIKVLDSYDEEFLHSNAKIGISKLVLLSSLTSDERIELDSSVSIENVTVSDLKAEIEHIKLERDSKISQYKMDLSSLDTKLKEKENETSKALDKIEELKKQLDTLKNQPKEKELVQDPELQNKIDLLNNQIKIYENTLKLKDEKIKEFDNKQKLNISAELIEFKFLFDEVQSIISKLKALINLVPEDKQNGCKEALKKVGTMLC